MALPAIGVLSLLYRLLIRQKSMMFAQSLTLRTNSNHVSRNFLPLACLYHPDFHRRKCSSPISIQSSRISAGEADFWRRDGAVRKQA